MFYNHLLYCNYYEIEWHVISVSEMILWIVQKKCQEVYPCVPSQMCVLCKPTLFKQIHNPYIILIIYCLIDM